MIELSLRGVLAALMLLSFLALYRVIRGPHAADRLVAGNVILTNVVLMILIQAHLTGHYYYLDVAFVYVLSSFAGTVCILKSLGKGKLS
ncbi:MAG: cation:proton antiporter [Dethiobacter sp.]|nr:cation:proton antiporter [Dethiobacter sp.]